jgi:hypothetical protein
VLEMIGPVLRCGREENLASFTWWANTRHPCPCGHTRREGRRESGINNSLWPCAATCGKLFAMGNKDARKREVRKPPKKKPPKHVVNQAVTQIVYKPTAPKP